MKTFLLTLCLSLVPSLAFACPIGQVQVPTPHGTFQCVSVAASQATVSAITVVRTTPAQTKQARLKQEAEAAVTVVERAFENVNTDCAPDRVEAFNEKWERLVKGTQYERWSGRIYTNSDGCMHHWYRQALDALTDATESKATDEKHIIKALREHGVRTPYAKLLAWLEAKVASLSTTTANSAALSAVDTHAD